MKTYALAVFSGLALAPALHADVILDWNATLLNSIAGDANVPPIASRMMAMVHVAQYEAVNSVDRRYRAYSSYIDTPGEASKEAAAAQAAHDVLVSLKPGRAAEYDAQLATHLAAIADGTAKTNGINLGRTSAQRIIQSRANDHSGETFTYTGSTDIGKWRPTAPSNANGLLPNWPNVTPWTMTSGSQFRPSAPPSLSSAEYAAAYNEVKELGRSNSATRTAEQTDIARMWAAGGGTVTPPGMWNQIARQISESRSLSIDENARLFAMLGAGEADAAVVAWDAKYEYNLWRPITAIQLGDVDGNMATTGDPSWTPLLGTPAFPSYTSGHSTFSATAATILAQFLGTDGVHFSATGAGITREFSSLWAAAEEAGMSRIYGGIHFQFDNTAGLLSGHDLGMYLCENFFAVPTPGAASVMVAGVLLASRRRR